MFKERSMKLLNTKYTGNLMIIAATLIWGAGFVAQSAGMNYVSPLTFNAARFFIGGTIALFFTLLYWARQKSSRSEKGHSPAPFNKKNTIAGFICGAVLCLAINLQQFGIQYTSVANASFITSLYVIMVPIVCLVLFKKKVSIFVWVGAGVALVGIYFLSLSGGLSINFGDILIFLCAIMFCAQILVISHFSPKHNVVALACVQFYTVFAISIVLAFIFETPAISSLTAATPYVLYTGILSSGIAYILQMKAQKTTDATVAAVLFSFESVIAALAGWVILSETLSPRELIGCVLVFCAIMIAQIPSRTVAL